MLTGLSDKKIVQLLQEHSLWRKKACREILGRKDDFTPLLLNILDETIKDTASFDFGVHDQYIPAALLLAKMREPKAYPRLVSLISYDEEEVRILWDDFLSEHYAQILRDTFNGDKSLLPSLIENRSICPWSRIAAIEAWGMHYFDTYITREEITGSLRRFIQEAYAGPPDDNDKIVLSFIADCVRNHQLYELLADVKGLFDRKYVEKDFHGDYDRFIEGFNDPDQKVSDNHIDDPIMLMEMWGFFQDNASFEDEDLDDYSKTDDGDYYDDIDDDDDSIERPRRVIKIGRNEPCPCGSGKKYKNCCMNK